MEISSAQRLPAYEEFDLAWLICFHDDFHVKLREIPRELHIGNN